MNVTRKKFLRLFVKYNFWESRVKECSTTLSTQKILKTKFSDKIKDQTELSLGLSEKNKIIDSILCSEISPYINESAVSLLKSYITFKRSFQTKHSFVVDINVAKDIVDKILPELRMERSFVVEGNPGLGLITLNLIKSQVPKIHLYENSKLKIICLQQLLDKYPNQLQLQNYNILIPRNNHLGTILDNALKLNVNNKIIGVVQQLNFFTCFIQECVMCSLWKSLEVTDFFLIITKAIWKNMVQDTESRPRYLTYCFFHLIFEAELLAEYPSSAFLPYSPHYRDDKMYFVKISKKPNFPGELNDEDVKSLLNFCKILGRSKFNYIIPTLEQWIPECGPYVISKGISVTNQINDLSYEEFQKLYLFLKKFKGFQNFGIVN